MKVLVTGGAGGIGLAIAQRFMADGAQVLICDVDGTALDQAVAAMPGLLAVPCDVSDVAQIDTLFESQILGLFLEGGGEAIAIGVHMMDIVNWSYLIFGVTMMMFATMRANGIVLAPLVILTVSLFFVRIGFYYLSYPIIGIEGLWWSFTFSSAVALLLAWLYYRFGKWRSVRLVVPAKQGAKAA